MLQNGPTEGGGGLSSPEHPYLETSINEFLIYWKHRYWRIRPVDPNNVAVKEMLKSKF